MQPDGWATKTQLKVIKMFEEIVASLGTIYEKSKDPEIKCVRDAMLCHMILFNLFLANLLQISNKFCKFLQIRAIQFSLLPGKAKGWRNGSDNT